MNRGIRQVCVATLLGAGVTAGAALPAAAQQFSADLVSSRDEDSSRTQKVYVADGKYRIETERGVMIADSSVTHMLMPQRKTYMDLPMPGMLAQLFAVEDAQNACPHWMEMMRREAPEDADKAQCKRVGNETIGGRSAVKYEAISPKGEKGYAWIDPKLRAVLKTQGSKGNGFELRNIKEAAQPAELFQIPADYKKLDMGQMRQGMPPQGGKP